MTRLQIHIKNIESRVIGTYLCKGSASSLMFSVLLLKLNAQTLKRFEVHWATDWLSREREFLREANSFRNKLTCKDTSLRNEE